MKHSAICCSLLALAALPGCKPDLCQGEAPAFQLTVSLGDKLTAARVQRLLLDLEVVGRKKQLDLTVDQEMVDGSTSVVLQVGSAGSSGFAVKATVEAFDKGGRRLARDKGEFSASGDACNYFTVSLTGEGQLDSGATEAGAPDMKADGPRPDGPAKDTALKDQAPAPDNVLPPKDQAPPADKPQPPKDMAPPPDKALPPKDMAPTPDAGPPPPAAVGGCSADNWCWMNPLPQGNALSDVWVGGPNAVFAVGEGGAIVRFDGAQATQMASGTTNNLYGIWGFGPSDLFVVGFNGTALHFDGTSWSKMAAWTTSSLHGVWGSSPTHVLAVGRAGATIRFGGSSWAPMVAGTSQDLSRVWGTAPTNAYAVGKGGTALRYDGAKWTSMTTNTKAALYDVWGTSASNVYATGYKTMLRHDGSKWSAVASAPLSYATGIWGSDPTNILVNFSGLGLKHFDGLKFSAVNLGPYAAWAYFSKLGGSGPNNVVVVGGYGVMLRFNGKAWGPLETRLQTKDLYAAWGSGPTNVYAAGAGGLFHYDGKQWTPTIKQPPVVLNDLWGSSATQLFGVSGAKFCQLASAGWQCSPTATSGSWIAAMWGSSPTDIHLVGSGGKVGRWDGAQFKALAPVSTAALYRVWGSGPTDVYAVGSKSTIIHFDGTKWGPVSTGTSYDLRAIWGSGPTNVLVLENYYYQHYDGKAWNRYPSKIKCSAHAMWGSNPTNVYASCSGGRLAHFDGTTWTTRESGMIGTYDRFNGIWGSSPSDIFAVGSGGAIVHYAGP